jgi:beta-mannosidase
MLKVYAFLSIAVVTATARKIVADAYQSLDSTQTQAWTVSNGTLSFSASVPGDLITDLSKGGVLGDPLYELNFKRTDWDDSVWNYSTSFTLDSSFSSSATVWIVFDGIKMVSDVSLNGIALGYTQDQFLRYSFDITSAIIKGGVNTLVVSFSTGKDQRNSEQRWMSCSGG